MTDWLLYAPAVAIALVIAWSWWSERKQPKPPEPLKPWWVRLKPRHRK